DGDAMAIVLHAARATRDWLPAGVRRGDRMYHMLSDIPGPGGTRELREFALKLGFRERWMQYPGGYREHFDVTERDARAILARGDARLIANHELGALLAAKRAFLDTP
ncbi:MAG TPA: DUF4031 domain-containing protein, partial [Ktedonobacterales bacterium]|nr:DUF4031 domain-containing protein [Ktedonobacterales bacterium]